MQRMGVVVVGPSGCGKSTIWRVLKLALAKLGKTILTYVMNPKSMPREQLLGHMDMDTREWFDGVLTSSARKASSSRPMMSTDCFTHCTSTSTSLACRWFANPRTCVLG